jgi:hypothetical protein
MEAGTPSCIDPGGSGWAPYGGNLSPVWGRTPAYKIAPFFCGLTPVPFRASIPLAKIGQD